MRLLFLFGSLLVAATTVAQTQKASDVEDFVSVDTSVFVLDHVRVIDGTGAPAKEDQAIVIANGKIQSIGPAASAQIPKGAQLIERSLLQPIRPSLPQEAHRCIGMRSAVSLVGAVDAQQGPSPAPGRRFHTRQTSSLARKRSMPSNWLCQL